MCVRWAVSRWSYRPAFLMAVAAFLSVSGCGKVQTTESAIPVSESSIREARISQVLLRSYAVPVSSLAFSPDGKALVTAGGPYERPDNLPYGGPGEVGLWDLVSGVRKIILTGYNTCVMSVALFPDGKRLVTGSADVHYSGRGAPREQGELRIWKLNGKEEWAARTGSKVGAVAISPDGQSFAAVGWGGEVILQDLKSGAKRVFGYHKGVAVSAAFSPDGKILASAGAISLIILWDAHTGKKLAALQGHKGAVKDVAFTPNGKVLVSGSYDGTIKLWDIDTCTESVTLTGHTGKVLAVAVSPDGKLLASGDDHKTIKVWDMGSRRELKVFSHKVAKVLSLAFSPSGKVLAAAGADQVAGEKGTPGGVTLWDVETGADVTPPR